MVVGHSDPQVQEVGVHSSGYTPRPFFPRPSEVSPLQFIITMEYSNSSLFVFDLPHQ